MKLFSSRLPADALASLTAHVGARPHVLAWATTGDGVVVALPDRLSVAGDDGWGDTPWHDVLSGGWDPERSTMRWTRVSDGTRVELPLVRAGRFPDVFRERVEASIVFQQNVSPRPGRVLTITARRDLGDNTVRWMVHPGRGVHMDDPETRAFAEAELRRLRAEYAF